MLIFYDRNSFVFQQCQPHNAAYESSVLIPYAGISRVTLIRCVHVIEMKQLFIAVFELPLLNRTQSLLILCTLHPQYRV